MIKASSELTPFATIFSSDKHQSIADAPQSKGGAGAGFDPHELLEAALATCINIVVRKRAVQLNIGIGKVITTVRLDRSHQEGSLFEYDLLITASISDEQRAQLVDAAKTCPVSQTLAKPLVLRASTSS